MSEAYKQGWNACNAGRLIFCNPYQNSDYHEWKRGWTDCQNAWNDGESAQPKTIIPEIKHVEDLEFAYIRSILG